MALDAQRIDPATTCNLTAKLRPVSAAGEPGAVLQRCAGHPRALTWLAKLS